MLSRAKYLFLATILGWASLSTTAIADGQAKFILVNDERVKIVVYGSAAWCVDAERPARRDSNLVMEPGEKYEFVVHRGHLGDCDGEMGVFDLRFATIDGKPLARKNTISNDFNDNIVNLNDGNHVKIGVHHGGSAQIVRSAPNNLPIKFSLDPYSGTYEIRTPGFVPVLEKVTVGKGYWDLVCASYCDSSSQSMQDSRIAKASEFSSSERNEIAASIEANWADFASMSLSRSSAQTVARRTSEEFSSGRSDTTIRKYSISLSDMRTFNIGGLWNYVVDVRNTSRGTIQVRSPYFVCTTQVHTPPTDDPLQIDARSCSGSLEEQAFQLPAVSNSSNAQNQQRITALEAAVQSLEREIRFLINENASRKAEINNLISNPVFIDKQTAKDNINTISTPPSHNYQNSDGYGEKYIGEETSTVVYVNEINQRLYMHSPDFKSFWIFNDDDQSGIFETDELTNPYYNYGELWEYIERADDEGFYWGNQLYVLQ